MSNGKGSSPRNIFSKQFRDNYDAIDFGHSKKRKRKSEVTDTNPIAAINKYIADGGFDFVSKKRKRRPFKVDASSNPTDLNSVVSETVTGQMDGHVTNSGFVIRGIKWDSKH